MTHYPITALLLLLLLLLQYDRLASRLDAANRRLGGVGPSDVSVSELEERLAVAQAADKRAREKLKEVWSRGGDACACASASASASACACLCLYMWCSALIVLVPLLVLALVLALVTVCVVVMLMVTVAVMVMVMVVGGGRGGKCSHGDGAANWRD